MRINNETSNTDKEENKRPIINLNLDKKTIKKLCGLIVFTVFTFWVFNNFSVFFEILNKGLSLVTPFIIGFCIAFVINAILVPIEKLWQKIFKKSKGKIHEKLKRPICLILCFLIVISVIFAVFFMIIPELKNTVMSFVEALPGYLTGLETNINKLLDFLEGYGINLPEINFDIDKVAEMAKTFLMEYGDSVINQTVNITASIVTLLVNIGLAIVFSFYILYNKETWSRQTKKVTYAVLKKDHADKFFNIAKISNKTFTNFVTGQLIEAVILGVLCFIGMKIFRFDYAGIISTLIGVTALIPVFGAFFGTAVGAFLLLLVSPMKAFWFVVFIIVLQQIDGNFIYPKVVGKSVGLPGVLVLIAVTIGGGTFGVLGMLFSVPLVSVLYTLCRQIVNNRLKSKQIVIE